jgi:hypothetical protein
MSTGRFNRGSALARGPGKEVLMDEEIRPANQTTDPPQDEDAAPARRKMLKSAAALAAAALGGGFVASRTDAQRRTTEREAVHVEPVISYRNLKVRELTRPALSIQKVRPELGDPAPLLADIERYVQPILDRVGAAATTVGVTAVDSNVSVSAT